MTEIKLIKVGVRLEFLIVGEDKPKKVNLPIEKWTFPGQQPNDASKAKIMVALAINNENYVLYPRRIKQFDKFDFDDFSKLKQGTFTILLTTREEESGDTSQGKIEYKVNPENVVPFSNDDELTAIDLKYIVYGSGSEFKKPYEFSHVIPAGPGIDPCAFCNSPQTQEILYQCALDGCYP